MPTERFHPLGRAHDDHPGCPLPCSRFPIFQIAFSWFAVSPAWFLPFPDHYGRRGFGHTAIAITVHSKHDHGDFVLTSNEPPQDSVIPGGQIEIADSAIIGLIHEAVLSCYGVVDIGPRSLGSAIVWRLGIGSGPHGIGIENTEGRLTIELSIVVEYGTPIFTVARNVMQAVTFQVERTLGMPVERVNVNVDGLRVSAPAGDGA